MFQICITFYAHTFTDVKIKIKINKCITYFFKYGLAITLNILKNILKSRILIIFNEVPTTYFNDKCIKQNSI